MLKDLLNDTPVEKIAEFYSLSIGEIQAFQHRCSVFSAVVTSFCDELKWYNLYNVLLQYSDRINFVV